MLTLAVVALHGLGALPEHVGTLAARADQRIGTLGDEVALLLAISAAVRALFGALLGEVALLVTVATLDRGSRLGTIGLVVAVCGCQPGSPYCECMWMTLVKHTQPHRS